MEPPRATLERLPVELVNMILELMPDVRSLLAIIAASPSMLRGYLYGRDKILTIVIANQIGACVAQQAVFLIRDGPETLESFNQNLGKIEVVEVQPLLVQEEQICEIIQKCVDEELESEVNLTDIEWLRLRRGMYNLKVAACLSGALMPGQIHDIRPYCMQLPAADILEMLYILDCLQNSLTKSLDVLEKGLLEDINNHGFRPDFFDEHIFFATNFEYLQSTWITSMPWTTVLDDLWEACQIRAWYRSWTPDPAAIHGHALGLRAVLASIVPLNIRFDEPARSGLVWIQQSDPDGNRYDYHYAIPLGFMIWDEWRLEDMPWMHKPPPQTPPIEKWTVRDREYRSIQDRV